MAEKRQYTVAERELINNFLSQRLGQFERGVLTSREMVRLADFPMHRNQLKYYENCVSCIKKLLADLWARPVLTEDVISGDSR